ncbi:unnamed protein product [Brassica oleracea var. botrytis]|uniref:Nicotiana lesion-inducing like n=3 Tax=Brassica TaxID=3705 RepID=A0A8S9HIW3_BRACR|nr:hypothetical protein F2Q68_00012830 [Brassica cretica]KAF3588761.1 hypothetical protein F2Q69_00025802 [Brassica cretica]KAF3611179.1 hypothetical protein DY000_02044347 [Brassica cretica]VDD41484.1 unnamed protein product [Brassica oleracea]
MGFFSFLGRVLFASLFILSAWQMFNDFGADGGPAAKELAPKLGLAKSHLSSRLGVALPDIEVKQVVSVIVALKGLGGLLFVVGNIFGAYLLAFYLVVVSPILYDFYNYGPEDRQFSLLLTEFLQSVALLGALLFFIGMKNSRTTSSSKSSNLKKRTPKPKAA